MLFFASVSATASLGIYVGKHLKPQAWTGMACDQMHTCLHTPAVCVIAKKNCDFKALSPLSVAKPTFLGNSSTSDIVRYLFE